MIRVGDRDVVVEQHYMDVMSAQQNGFVTFAETKVNISSTS